MANTTNKVLTPKAKTIEAASASALDTATIAQVNTLIQAYLDPENTGAAVGTVQNGSIRIAETRTVITTNNVVTYQTTVLWNEWILPT